MDVCINQSLRMEGKSEDDGVGGGILTELVVFLKLSHNRRQESMVQLIIIIIEIMKRNVSFVAFSADFQDCI